jgi:glycosyltransferase involved in cell wall biosynthesis
MKILCVGPIKNSGHTGDTNSLDTLSGLGVDGPSRSILGLAYALTDKGAEVAVLPTKPFRVPAQEQGAPMFLGPYIGRKYNPFVHAGRWMNLVERQFGHPDLVNFHDVYDLFSVAFAATIRSRGWEYMVTPRGGLRRYAQRRDSLKKKIANPLFFKRYLRKALCIHALAEGEAEDIHHFDPTLRTVVIPNGISSKVLAHPQKVFPPKEGNKRKRIVGFIGQIFVEIKGIDLLLEAVAELQKLGKGNNLQFVLVGPIPNRSDRRWVSQMKSRLLDPGAVKLVGPKLGNEKWELLESFDVLILPSRTEGMPVVALEAMARGKPCLFSEGTNMAELVQTAGAGWGCRVSAESILKKLLEISKISEEALVEMGKRGRAVVEERFTWGVVADRYLGTVQTILDSVQVPQLRE